MLALACRIDAAFVPPGYASNLRDSTLLLPSTCSLMAKSSQDHTSIFGPQALLIPAVLLPSWLTPLYSALYCNCFFLTSALWEIFWRRSCWAFRPLCSRSNEWSSEDNSLQCPSRASSYLTIGPKRFLAASHQGRAPLLLFQTQKPYLLGPNFVSSSFSP